MIGTMAAAGMVRAYWRPLAGLALVAAVLLLTYATGRRHANEAWEVKHAAAVAGWHVRSRAWAAARRRR